MTESKLSAKPNVLFLCTGNSCRSQMAEGLARHQLSGHANFYSAGIETHGLNPHAAAALAEQGIDISAHHSKTLDDLSDVQFDLVITVCGHAHETCPLFPGEALIVHRGFDDPPALAKTLPNAEQQFACYQRVRDEIAQFVQSELPAHIQSAVARTA